MDYLGMGDKDLSRRSLSPEKENGVRVRGVCKCIIEWVPVTAIEILSIGGLDLCLKKGEDIN